MFLIGRMMSFNLPSPKQQDGQTGGYRWFPCGLRWMIGAIYWQVIGPTDAWKAKYPEFDAEKPVPMIGWWRAPKTWRIWQSLGLVSLKVL
jgi:hypothetical protein